MNSIGNHVSVIIPAFNAAGFLKRAIESALNQTLAPLEIIVVDDGSTDDTASVATAYGNRIRYLAQANAGAASARNAGAGAARGELFAFLDADDQWHLEKLRLQAAVLREYPNLALCTCGVRLGVEGEQPASLARDPPEVRFITDFREVFRRPYFGTPTVVMPRRVFEDCNGFDETLVTGEDVDLWLRACFGRDIGVVGAVLVSVFRRADSLSRGGTHEGNLMAIDRFCELHPEFMAREASLVRRVRAEIYTSWGSEALAAERWDAAKELLHAGLRQRLTFRGLYLASKLATRRLGVGAH